IEDYAKKVGGRYIDAIRRSSERIRRYHEKQIERDWSYVEDGVKLGQLIRAIGRVGVYVPGGKAAYPSTVLMNVIPAQVAGVHEIAVTVPMPGGQINPYVMAAVHMLGVREVYGMGGAQAVAAFAYGTESVKKVDKIVGPGNIYVASAKRLVFGEVDIDMIAGPSEILVIADGSVEPSLVAADLLSQAEHDEMASAILVTTEASYVREVISQVEKQLSTLSRRSIAMKSIETYGAAIVVEDMNKAFRISNKIAPEHLELMINEPQRYVSLVKNAGAVFLGRWSCESLGDYSAGPNHTLPTAGTARFFSPLGVYDFLKRTSFIEFTEGGFKAICDTVEVMSTMEGLDGHGNSVRFRKQLPKIG
ncbi:MAG: histidinol dehydrogenase, partial [Candidatus Magnetoovum sp. WYHC-5]|nr:histidinol dehydrogenase [Candidatus Magnetoovum sp. WYHC-5]